MTQRPAAPQDFRIETRRFILRDLERADVTERACAWLADPVKARMINAVPRAMTPDQFGDYIADHDRISGHLLGVFDKRSGDLVGLWAVHIDWEYSEFRLSVLIGERIPGAVNIRSETQRELLRHLFEVCGLTTLRCSVLARNDAIGAKVFAAAGVEPEHVSYNVGAQKEGFIEVRHYRVSRDIWRDLAARAATGDLQPLAVQIGV
jgi:RimJ/RimL family protein N-acetyltransferase